MAMEIIRCMVFAMVWLLLGIAGLIRMLLRGRCADGIPG